MSQRSLAIDAWLREAQEVSRMVEDVESRINVVMDLEQEHRLRDIANSKIFEVGVKLDRLESLLHNPPSKPILTGEDLKFRWKMLSDLQLRTRALVSSLYTSTSAKREGGLPTMKTRETDITIGGNDQELMKPLVLKDNSDLVQTLVDRQDRQLSGSISTSFLRNISWTICFMLGAAAVLVVLVILCKIL